MDMWEAVIVGGGPAGLSAGLHLSRAGHRVILVEKGRLGGQARGLGRLENYPGFLSINSDRLMDRWLRQARLWGLKTCRAEVRRIRRAQQGFLLSLDQGRGLSAQAVVYCPGAIFKDLGVPGEKRLLGRGVFHEAGDEVSRWKGRAVVVAGGGEAAAHQALALARSARKVFLICRGEKIRAHRLLQKRLASSGRIVKVFGAEVCRVLGKKRVQAVEIRSRAGLTRISAAALFVLVGKIPARLPWSRSPAGFFVAGDAQGWPFRQVAIASGDGMRAAMECIRFLEKP